MANETTRKAQEAQAEEQRQDLLDRIEELEQQLAGARAEAGGSNLCGCIWCGETVGLRTDLTLAAKVRAHLGSCEKNPLVHEIKRLQATLQANGWHHDRLADADRIFGELEAGRARAANEVLDLRARQRELLTSLATTASLSAVLQTRLEEAEKKRGATSAKLDALEHKLWALVGGPVAPDDDLVEAIEEELDCSSCVDQKRDLAQDANAVLDAIRNLVQATWAFKPAEGSIEELLAALERNVAEDQATARLQKDALAKCADAMELWGSQEDGIHEAGETLFGSIGKAYEEACRLSGRAAAKPSETPVQMVRAPKYSVGQRIEYRDDTPGFGTVLEVLTRVPGKPESGFSYRANGWGDGTTGERVVAEESVQAFDIPF